MIDFIKIYLVALIIFLGIDGVWLAIIAKNFYQDKLGFIMTDHPNWLAAIILYVFMVVGLVFFVINPALAQNSLKYAILAGVLFGAVGYATYDLTNLATLKNWPLIVSVIDIVWGGILNGLVAGLTFLIFKK